MSASAALGHGIVDAVLTPGRSQFASVVEDRARELVRDHGLLAKAARLSSPATLKDMHRARMFEGIVSRDNVKDATFGAARHAWVHKHSPAATPLHLAGQAAVTGRVLDGKALAAKKVNDVKAAVEAHGKVNTHIYTHKNTYKNTHKHTHKHIQTHTNTHKHIQTHKYMHIPSPAHQQDYTLTDAHVDCCLLLLHSTVPSPSWLCCWWVTDPTPASTSSTRSRRASRQASTPWP